MSASTAVCQLSRWLPRTQAREYPCVAAVVALTPSTACAAHVRPDRQGDTAPQRDPDDHDHAGGVRARFLVASLLRRRSGFAEVSLRATPRRWKPGRATVHSSHPSR